MENKKGGAKAFGIAVVLGIVVMMAMLVYADSQSTDATLTVTNEAPSIESVTPVSAVTLNAGTTKDVYILFNVSDPNGAGDINATASLASVTKAGEATRSSSGACGQENTGPNWIYFNCTVTMYYYDGSGSWAINVSIADNSSNTAFNDSETFTVNALDSITLGIATIDFGSAGPGVSDVAGTDLPVNNTGNTNYTTVQITGYDLVSGINSIGAANFCGNDIDDANTGCDALVNATAQTITASTLPKGDNSVETLYTFVDVPGGQPSGSYSALSNWVITTS